MGLLEQDFEAFEGATERFYSTMLAQADAFHDTRDFLTTFMPIM